MTGELAHYDTFSASTRDKWLKFLGKFAAAEVDLAVRGALTEDKPRPGVARLCDCARLLLPHSYEAAKRASGYLANARILANAEELSAFADVAQAAILWSRSVDSGPPPEVEYVVFRSFALSSLPALTPRSVFPSSLDKDLVDALASKFSTCEESGALLLRVSRSVQSLPEFSDTSLNSVVNCVTKFPRVALGLLDTFGCISQAVLDATLAAYTASLSSMDRIALRILTRCGLPADSIGLRAWAARKTSTNEEKTATESLSGVIEVVAGEWIFDFLQPDRIAASVVRFPLSRGITGGDDMEDDDDDDFSVDVPEDDDDDEDIEMADDDDADEVPDEIEGLDWEDQRIGRKDDDNDNSSEDATEEESDKEEEDDADQNSDEGSDVDDYEAEDGLSLADEEEIVNEETVWCAKCYDPRFVLPACYNCLTAAEKTEDEEEEARITRRAYESGAIAYAAAALSSKRSKTRSLAAGVLGRFSAKLGTGAASMDRGFVARPFVRTLLDATFAALKEASDPLHGPRRLPCLWSSVIARCFEALMSPRHPGFAVAAAHAVRRAIARPWHDAPLVRDAFLNDQGVANFCDDDALDKVRARFWSYECLVDGARDDNDAKALKRSGVLTLSMCRMEELLVGGASIVGEDKRVILKYAGMAPPGAASLLQQKNGKEDLKKLRKVNILAQAEGDAAHRMLASIGRSRYGKRILFTEWAVTYLASRLASTHEARDIELVGAILHFTCEDLDYFTEEREPLLFGYLDLAAEIIMRGFYKLSQLPEERREIDPAYREVVLDEVDDGDLDEFFSTPLKCVGDFDDDTKKSSLSASEASVEASSRFFFRRYLVTRHVALAGLGRISQFTDRRVSIIEAWCMMRAMIIMCYGGEDVEFHSASLRVLSTLDAADTKRLLALAPPVIMYLGYELNVELYDENPIGNRLYTPLIEIIVSILIARLLTTRISRCLVSTRRQLVATVDLVLRVARIHQAKPGVDMLAAARLDLGLGFGLAFRVEERLSSSPSMCPHHRIHDLRRASKELADEDCLGERRGMACSLDVLLADAIHEEEVSSAPRDLIIPADVAKLLSHDDILNSPNPQPGDESHLRAIKRIEALAPSLASNSLTAETAHRILREYKRPDFDPKALDVYTNLKFCDVCQGKKPAPDLEKLDPHKRRWWRVDLDPNS